MIMSDYHMHTTFCDGKNTPEEMVLSAINKGLKEVGVVIHSHLPFYPQGACKGVEGEQAFAREMARVKDKYADKISVKCGIEMDFFSPHVPENFDYIIGSVHFFDVGDKLYPIDSSEEKFRFAISEAFGGDVYAAAENYYNNVSLVVKKHNADIIGHIDLITKFNEVDSMIDTANPRYVKAWKSAVDSLIPYGKPFEVNTGAISRGYRTSPYPALDIANYIKSKGGKLIMSSDSHSAENIAFQYEKWQSLIK